MNLWIRSQNKGALIKVESVWCVNGFIRTILGSKDTILGMYRSNERAKEILDEIQKKIKGTYLMKAKNDLVDPKYYEPAKAYHSMENDINIVCGDNLFDITPINTDFIVYEMPKE